MTEHNNNNTRRYILYNNNNQMIFARMRFCDNNCKEDFVFNNSFLKIKIIYGANNDIVINKNIYNVNELFINILSIYNVNNNIDEDIYPFQYIEILNQRMSIAKINFIEFINNNRLYIEISNPGIF